MTEDFTRHLRAAAQAIAGDETPSDWLIASLRRVAETFLVGLILYEVAQPNRAKIRRRTKSVRDAAQLILDEVFPPMDRVRRISDAKVFPLRDFLLNEGEHWLKNEVEMFHGLRALVDQCDLKLTETSTKGGRGRPLPAMVEEHTASGSTVCALTVSLLWQRVHGRHPGVSDGRAHGACSELWRAAGGGAVRNKDAGWRVDLQEARKPRYQGTSSTIKKVMSVQEIDR